MSCVCGGGRGLSRDRGYNAVVAGSLEMKGSCLVCVRSEVCSVGNECRSRRSPDY